MFANFATVLRDDVPMVGDPRRDRLYDDVGNLRGAFIDDPGEEEGEGGWQIEGRKKRNRGRIRGPGAGRAAHVVRYGDGGVVFG